jgi:hypothetical protein
MRPLVCLAGALSGLSLAGAARAERICTGAPADSAVSVALRISDDGALQGGDVHWAVPNARPDLPSMVHIVYPLDGDHAGSRPTSVITLNSVTGAEIVRSPTASVQIVIDGMDMAVRAWDLYAEAVEQLNARSSAEAVSKASFVGAVPFTPRFEDGRRDLDSTAALSRIGQGAQTLEVRLLGEDGMALQDHTYRLFDMPTPPPKDVQSALAAGLAMAREPARCQSY